MSKRSVPPPEWAWNRSQPGGERREDAVALPAQADLSPESPDAAAVRCSVWFGARLTIGRLFADINSKNRNHYAMAFTASSVVRTALARKPKWMTAAL